MKVKVEVFDEPTAWSERRLRELGVSRLCVSHVDKVPQAAPVSICTQKSEHEAQTGHGPSDKRHP